MPAGLQEPYEEYSVGMAELGKDGLDLAEVGKVVQIDFLETGTKLKSYITGIFRSIDNPGSNRVTLANRPQDIASTIAEMADRQRIEMAYSRAIEGGGKYYRLPP